MSRQLACAIWLVVASAEAAPRMAVVATGDCRDADLLQDSRLFTQQLEQRLGPALLDEDGFRERVGAPPSHNLEEVRQQVATAENLFYNDRHPEAVAVLDQVATELSRLPPGPDRWAADASALLLRGMTLNALRRRDASDDAFRQVLRIQATYQMSPDAYSPFFRNRFERLRQEQQRARRVRLTVSSKPSGAPIFVQGSGMGRTPAVLELIPGTYQVLVGKPEAPSFPHVVTLREDAQLSVDLAFEQSIPASRIACLQQPPGDATPGNALKLGLLLAVEDLVLLRLDRPSAGPAWLSAAVLDTQRAQKTREGGLQLREASRPPEALGELATFVVTGETGKQVVVVHSASAASPPLPAFSLAASPPSARTWRTPTGVALTGAGVAAAALAVAFQIKANDSAGRFNALYANGAAPDPSQAGQAAQFRSDASTQRTVAAVALGVAGVAIASGLYLWLGDGTDTRTGVVIGPGGVSLAGTFR